MVGLAKEVVVWAIACPAEPTLIHKLLANKLFANNGSLATGAFVGVVLGVLLIFLLGVLLGVFLGDFRKDALTMYKRDMSTALLKIWGFMVCV